MVKKIVQQQKEELEGLLKQEYLERMDAAAKTSYLSTGLIKLITGPLGRFAERSGHWQMAGSYSSAPAGRDLPASGSYHSNIYH